MQGGVAIKRPDQEGAEDSLAKNVSDLGCGEVVADFAAFLPELNHLGMEGVDAFLQIEHGFSHGSRREIGLKKGTNYGGISCGLLSHAQAKRTKEFGHRFIGPASGLNGCLQLAKLHVAKGQQDVVFAWEVVEKSALADVRGFRDVFDGGFGESSSGEKIQSGAEKTFTDFRTATLTTARSGVRCDGAVSKVRCR